MKKIIFLALFAIGMVVNALSVLNKDEGPYPEITSKVLVFIAVGTTLLGILILIFLEAKKIAERMSMLVRHNENMSARPATETEKDPIRQQAGGSDAPDNN